MSDSDRAIMLGIRYRCGQEIQFWIPLYLVSHLVEGLAEQGFAEQERVILAEWMAGEGMIPDAASPPEDLLARLRSGLGPRDVAFIDVESDASVCAGCGTLLPWIDVLRQYVSEQSSRDC